MNDYKIEKIGNTWFVMETVFDHCLFATDTERKANNFLKRVLRDAGYTN